MQLHEFKNDKGASTISSEMLDSNFRRVRPLATDGPSRQYAVTETPEGWQLTLFLDKMLTAPTNLEAVREVITKEIITGDGALTVQGSVLTQAISPGLDGSLMTTVGGSTQWSTPPPSGTPEWRQVERCDGQTMYVWGPEWE